MTLLLWWLTLCGVWPLADPGHNDLTSSLVLLDLVLHGVGGGVLLNREINRRAINRAARITSKGRQP